VKLFLAADQRRTPRLWLARRPALVGPILLAVMLLVGIVPTALAATDEQINTARNKGLWWLLTRQDAEGKWKSKPGTEVAATATALEALSNAGVKSYPYTAGVSWLSNVKISSVDSLARQVVALTKAGVAVTRQLERLRTWGNDGFLLTWGAYDDFSTSFPDTPLGLSAFRIGQASSYLSDNLLLTVFCHILPAQRADGGWSYVKPVASAPIHAVTGGILPTTYTVLELHAIKTANSSWNNASCDNVTYSLSTGIDNGVAWLLTKKNADGGFGDNGVSTVFETALAYEVLKTLRPTDSATGAALDYLLSRQNSADGNWQGNAFTTAQVLKLLPATVLLDTDRDGVPDGVELLMGTNPNVADSRWVVQGSGRSVEGVTAAKMLANAVLNQPFSYTLTASGGTPPYTWSLTAGSLPPGLSLNGSTGVISGTPTAVGTYNFTYRATDAAAATTTTVGAITVIPPVTEAWVARYNGPANREDVVRGPRTLVTDSAGNVYVAGRSANGTNDDYTTIKYDSNGNPLWVARYDFGSTDEPRALAVDGAQNVYVTGTSCADVNCLNKDYATVKYGPNGGAPLWVARYDQGGQDEAVALGMDSVGNVYVTGASCQDVNCANKDYATIKYGPNGGAPLWVARYDNGGQDAAVALAMDNAGNVYVTGTSCADVNCANKDYATVKYGPSGGAPLWVARYDNGGVDVPVALVAAADGSGSVNVYVTGDSSNGLNADIATVKYGPNGGAPLWVARYNQGGADGAAALAVDTAGNVYVTGSSCPNSACAQKDYATVKYGPTGGTPLWVARYDKGGEDQASALVVDSAGNVYVTGAGCPDSACTNKDYATVKYGPNGGAPLWVVRYDHGGLDAAAALALVVEGSGTISVVVTGESSNGVNADFATVKYTQCATSKLSLPFVRGGWVG